MTWATPTEASHITGDTLDQDALDRAYHVLELLVGVTVEARENLKPRDHRLLKSAEAFQAAWMVRQVEFVGRSDVTLVDQDGLSYSKGDQDMHILAPLAKAAIKKLSWNRTRTMDALTADQALALRGKVTAETYGKQVHGSFDSDDFWGWRPL